MQSFRSCVIKSFKHDGHLHRMWLENWLVPEEQLAPEHRDEGMKVFINCQTKIREADGKEWVSRIPGVSFFIPKQWFNVVALIEDSGIRYYCNIASPFFYNQDVLTYIDYDLDVVVLPSGEVNVVDQEEFELHRVNYHYSQMVVDKVEDGLQALLERERQRQAPFNDEIVLHYYQLWKDRGV